MFSETTAFSRGKKLSHTPCVYFRGCFSCLWVVVIFSGFDDTSCSAVICYERRCNDVVVNDELGAKIRP